MDEYTDINKFFTLKRYEYYLSQVNNPSDVLEIGVGDFTGTKYLRESFPEDVTVYSLDPDPPETLNPFVLEYSAQDYAKEFSGTSNFDLVVLSHVLEHVELSEAKEILEAAWALTSPGGQLIVGVPNANSLHRKLGVRIGLLNNLHSLNEADIRLGHKRVWGYAEFVKFCSDILPKSADIIFGGTQLKIQPNSELEEKLNTEDGLKYLNALFDMGINLPYNAADIHCIATKVQK